MHSVCCLKRMIKTRMQQVAHPTLAKHGLNRAIERNVSTPSILDAVKNPLQIKNLKVDSMGRESQRFIGSKASVVVNPNTGKVVSVNPTSTQKVKSLGGSK